jgi:hypothetical protein
LGISARTKRTPDLDVCSDWAIEFKIVRPYGDNGKEAENWTVNLLHPYSGSASLIGDAIKLKDIKGYNHKGLFIIGYEHDPARINLDPIVQSFELIARDVLNPFTTAGGGFASACCWSTHRQSSLGENFVHPGAAHTALAFQRGAAVLHGDTLNIHHFSFGFLFDTITYGFFFCHSPSFHKVNFTFIIHNLLYKCNIFGKTGAWSVQYFGTYRIDHLVFRTETRQPLSTFVNF